VYGESNMLIFESIAFKQKLYPSCTSYNGPNRMDDGIIGCGGGRDEADCNVS